jgi:hypothetical protein
MASTREPWKNSQRMTRRQEPDRRDTCRYPVVHRSAVLGCEIGGTPVNFPVELENISMQGCLVTSRKALRTQPFQAVTLTFQDLAPAVPIQGTLVSVVKPFWRKQMIRIRFVDPLPFMAFKTLVYGPDGVDLGPRERPDYETDQFWR